MMMRANLGLLFTVFAWGTMIPSINVMVPRWEPFFLTTSRYLVAAPIFLLVVALVERERGLLRTLLDRRIWLLGAVGVGLFGPLLMVGIAWSHPVTAAVLAATAPALNAAVAWIGFGEPLDRSALPSMALAVAGGIVATYDPTGAEGVFALRGGEILIIIGTLCWAWYSLAAQRWLAGWSQLRVAGTTIATGSICSAVIYCVVAATSLAPFLPTVPVSAVDAGLFAWMTIGPVILGFILWHYAVRQLGFVISSLFVNLVPVVAILLTTLQGVFPTTLQLVGGALVLAGVLQSQLRRLPRPAAAAAK